MESDGTDDLFATETECSDNLPTAIPQVPESNQDDRITIPNTRASSRRLANVSRSIVRKQVQTDGIKRDYQAVCSHWNERTLRVGELLVPAIAAGKRRRVSSETVLPASRSCHVTPNFMRGERVGAHRGAGGGQA